MPRNFVLVKELVHDHPLISLSNNYYTIGYITREVFHLLQKLYFIVGYLSYVYLVAWYVYDLHEKFEDKQ